MSMETLERGQSFRKRDGNAKRLNKKLGRGRSSKKGDKNVKKLMHAIKG